MRNLKLTLAYDGTDFHGFQRQPKLRTVQGLLEERFSRLLDEDISVVGAGRTDAGVHASGQVINFRTNRTVTVTQLASALNGALPDDVKVQHCLEVSDDFQARRSARSRAYRYAIVTQPQPSPLLGRFALVAPDRFEVEAMQAAGALLLGKHDFAAFHAAGSETMTTERTVTQLECHRQGARIEITVEADSFLYQMVRIIVGGLLQVGRGERAVEALADALSSGKRMERCPPAPACGLCLTQVSY